MLEVEALAESQDGTRCIVLESKEVLRGEAEVTGIRLTSGHEGQVIPSRSLLAAHHGW